MRQWVWKYDVQARVDSGRTWFSLGVFEGNRDMTSEKAHKLLEPVECRYLRFRVLGYDRVAAMRVGVYGLRDGPQQVAQTDRPDAAAEPASGSASLLAAAAPALAATTEECAEFTISYPEEGMGLHRMPIGFASAAYRYRCPCCWIPPVMLNRRSAIRVAARKDVRDARESGPYMDEDDP